MLRTTLDAVMERRAGRLLAQIGDWLPAAGPVLDLGSGTGHLAARVARERGLDVVTADVSDFHVVGRPPVLIADGALPFAAGTFAAALLVFMLHYPRDAAGVLAEAARVTRGPVIVVQTLHANALGYAWLRVREFYWSYLAFHASRLVGYVAPGARFTMAARRFYSAATLRGELAAAGLRIRARAERPVLPGRALVVATWIVERDD